MVKVVFRHRMLLLVLALLSPIMMPAQSLPALKQASEITSGVLPNGVAYYLVTNSVSKNLSDVAVVRKRADHSEARKEIAYLPHFTSIPPFRFLADKGVDYGKDGYIYSDEVSTVFSFRNILLNDKDIADSTMMMVFDIVSSSQADQAVVVSGDFDKAQILERLKLFSMTVPHRLGINYEYEYIWEPRERAEYIMEGSDYDSVSSLTAVYSTPRTPKEYMGTMQPLVSRMFAEEIGSIVKQRLYNSLRLSRVPAAKIDFDYKSSAAGPSDERYAFTIFTDSDHITQADSVMASVLAVIDSRGVSLPEYKDARNQHVSNVLRSSSDLITNDYYVRKCGASFIYGADLASLSTQTEFFVSRDLADTTELRMFNRFVKALFDKEKNLTVKVSSAFSPSETVLRNVFNSAWDKSAEDMTDYRYLVNYGDTLTLKGRQSKVKLKVVKSEYVSGGELWTFSNGVKVVFKNTGKGDSFNYGFMVKGGYDRVPGLKKGEGAFVSDLLNLYDVSGLHYRDFSNMLEANGISMTPSVSLSDLRLTGKAPSYKLELLLKSLLSVANDRRLNPQAYKYYVSNERLRLEMAEGSNAAMSAIMDTIVRPDFRFSSEKLSSSLSDDLYLKADKYFNEQFSKIDDGVIVIIGNMDAERTKKLLSRYLGGFRTETSYNLSSPILYDMTSGGIMYTTIGDEQHVDLLMTARIPYSSNNFFAARIAGYVIDKALVAALADTGMYSECESVFETQPQDCFVFKIFCSPCDPRGLPATVSRKDAVSVLQKIRVTIDDLASKELSGAKLAFIKKGLLNNLSSQASDPEWITGAVLLKYSEGKDLVTKYQEKINSVTSAKIKEIISELNNGSKVEYLVYEE